MVESLPVLLQGRPGCSSSIIPAIAATPITPATWSALVQRLGLQQRVFYFHDSPLAPILRNPACCGVVLINSTVGYQTLFHGVPLKALGTAPVNIEGLADQQPLDSFWGAPRRSDRALFRRFYNHVLSTTQINGNFDGAFPFAQTFLVKGAFKSPLRRHRLSLAMVWRVPVRLIWWLRAAACAAIALVAGPRSSWLRAASKAVLQALGLRICLDCSDDQSFMRGSPSASRQQPHGLVGQALLLSLPISSVCSTVVPSRERRSADLASSQHVARPPQMEDRVIHWSVLLRPIAFRSVGCAGGRSFGGSADSGVTPCCWSVRNNFVRQNPPHLRCSRP